MKNVQSIVQKDKELWINGEKTELPKSLFFKNCICHVNGKLYINGKEFKNGKWKYTLKSIFNSLF